MRVLDASIDPRVPKGEGKGWGEGMRNTLIDIYCAIDNVLKQNILKKRYSRSGITSLLISEK